MTDEFHGLSGKVAIAGVGHTTYGKHPGRSAWSLQTEAIAAAVDDAGLEPSDVDGLFTESQFSEPLLMHGAILGRQLGMRPNYLSTQSQGGATCNSLAMTAAMAIHHGLCEVAVVSYGDNAKTGMPNIYGLAQMGRGQADFVAHGLLGGPAMEGLSAMRYKHTYDVSDAEFGAVPVAIREHATRNPNAQYRDPLSLDEYLESRYISEPLRLYDCTIASDGGAAIILTSAERAKSLRHGAVPVLGVGQGHNLNGLEDRDHYIRFGGERASHAAFAMAGIEPGDVDTAQFYDCFTSTVLITLEDYGFCGRGEAGAFAADGNLGLDGALPTNTSGGMLSEANMTGWNAVIEAVRQLRGEADDRQVSDCEIAVTSGHGGFQATHATMVLGEVLGADAGAAA